MAGEGCGRGTPSGRPTTPAPGGQPAVSATAPQDIAGCRNIKTQRIIEHPALTKSLAAVDEEQGTVVFWLNFGDTGTYGPGNALVTFEAFKVFDNQLQVVQAFLKGTAQGNPTWLGNHAQGRGEVLAEVEQLSHRGRA